MITKSDFINWKQSEIARKLNAICNDGKLIAVDYLIRNKGEVSDTARGSIETFDEILELLRTGEGIYEMDDIEENKDV